MRCIFVVVEQKAFSKDVMLLSCLTYTKSCDLGLHLTALIWSRTKSPYNISDIINKKKKEKKKGFSYYVVKADVSDVWICPSSPLYCVPPPDWREISNCDI